MSLIKGKLVVQGDQCFVEYAPPRKKKMKLLCNPEILHRDLASQPLSSLNGREVDIKIGGSLNWPEEISPVGETWIPPQIAADAQEAIAFAKAQNSVKPHEELPKGDFHNPYNFVPAPWRRVKHKDFGDNEPRGHACYLPDLWSGRITLSLTTKTPLLLPDGQTVQLGENDHKTYSTRSVSGKPYLASTSLKGMLRSAYEAITNSRFGVFESHDEQRAFRMLPDRFIHAARVVIDTKGKLAFRLMDQANLLAYETYREGQTIPVDKGSASIIRRMNYPHQRLPEHGSKVWVKLETRDYRKEVSHLAITNPRDSSWNEGWACIMGANCDNKRNERVFVERPKIKEIPISDETFKQWNTLISQYQDLHKDAVTERNNSGIGLADYLGNKPGDTAFSRHIYSQDYLALEEGRLCYVKLGENEKIEFAIPVTVSRQLFNLYPSQLLPESLLPARNWSELSPADRVFGWVNQRGKGSYKGQLRIHNLLCRDNWNEAVEELNPALALNILGQPKPEQFRFYSSSDKFGRPIDKGIQKEQGYGNAQQGLRGRKVYPHHRLAEPEQYWDARGEKEYLKPGERHTSQNRSITSWVKPAVEFTFDIDVVNLSDVELGALLYLLELPENHYHRLGGGKPLGFGSVKLTIADNDLRTGQGWQEYYRSLVADQTVDKTAAIATKETFLQAVRDTYGRDRQKPEFIEAFERSAQGFEDNLPICYPRKQAEPNPDGEGFDWFVDNESKDGFKRSLPPLSNDKGLPWKPKR
jgi:CRISPR-associated protein (TIGR03986 family)